MSDTLLPISRHHPVQYEFETESPIITSSDPLQKSGLYQSSIAKSNSTSQAPRILPPKLELPRSQGIQNNEASLMAALNEVRVFQDQLGKEQVVIDAKAYHDLSKKCQEKIKTYLKKMEESQTKEKTSTFLSWMSHIFFGLTVIGTIGSLITGNPSLLLAYASIGAGGSKIGQGVIDSQVSELKGELFKVTQHRVQSHQKMDELSEHMNKSHEIVLSFIKELREALESEMQTHQLIKSGV
ncbi:MAG: hypothetical protein WD595_06415 [Waddliaceae bacterium]